MMLSYWQKFCHPYAHNIEYLAIYSNENLPNSINNLPQ